jgi:hypothetical protein
MVNRRRVIAGSLALLAAQRVSHAQSPSKTLVLVSSRGVGDRLTRIR